MPDWYDCPLPFEGVDNLDVNRILNYMIVDRAGATYVRCAARRQSYQGGEDLVRDAVVDGARRIRRKFRDQLADPDAEIFVNARHVAGMANAVLDFALISAIPKTPPTSEFPSEETFDLEDDGGDLPIFAIEECGRLRGALTDLATSGQLVCWHENRTKCWHSPRSCPNRPIVLSVALQIVALREGALPPTAAGPGHSTLDIKYAIVAMAAPDQVGARQKRVPANVRQFVRRCWHCAESLISRAGAR